MSLEEQTPDGSGLVQKFYLVLAYLYLVPWFARQCVRCELPLRPFLDANPDLPLGGLPIASKLSRYGDEPPYLPSLTVAPDTPRDAIAEFLDEHGAPLVAKPLFGAHSRGVHKISTPTPDVVLDAAAEEPMILQPYVNAPREYGINVGRIGSRVKIYGLTEVTLRSVWGDGTHTVAELAADAYGPGVATDLQRGDWVPPAGRHVPLHVAADVEHGSQFRDITDHVTPELRAACQHAADQIDLRFGRFDVKAASLDALQDGHFHVLEVNGSPSMDLTLYDERYGLSVTIERLQAHWDRFFHQARPRRSSDPNTWRLLSTLFWFVLSPKRCVSSLCRDEVNDGKLTSGS